MVRKVKEKKINEKGNLKNEKKKAKGFREDIREKEENVREKETALSGNWRKVAQVLGTE